MDDLVKRLRKRAHEPVACTPFNILMEAADRVEELEAKLAKAIDGLTKIERTYYEEATNPRPETIRRVAARMNGIARDTHNAIAELTGGNDE